MCSMNSHGSIPVLGPTEEEIDLVLSEYACKKCFGRGYIGWTLGNDPVMCDCVERARRRIRSTPPVVAKEQQERVVQ